ncbi:MAG: hypothetical protein ACXAC7_16085 [Candidatus Hodarchaeales archaeon]|jgi:hypothetical protein
MDSWPVVQFEKHKEQLLETLSLQVGMDFTETKITSKNYHYNRFGTTAILEILLYDKDDPEYTNITIATIYKQVTGESTTIEQIEKKNSNLIHLLESFQSTWPSQKMKLEENFPIKDYPELPDQIFAPEIVHFEDQFIRYSTLNRFIRRDKSGVPPLNRYRIMGYVLGRFHGTGYNTVDLNVYSPYFTFLKNQGIEIKILEQWQQALETGKGGNDKYIFGDCTLENVQYNTLTPGNGRLDSLCLLDPVLITGGERTEDIGSVIANLGIKSVIESRQKDPEGSLRETLSKTLRYIVGKAGKELLDMYIQLNPDLLEQYELFPLDFFIGTFILQRASQYALNGSYDAALRDLLTVLGEQFLSTRPFAEVYQNI